MLHIYIYILYYTAIQYSLYHSILSVTPSLFQYLPMLVPGKGRLSHQVLQQMCLRSASAVDENCVGMGFRVFFNLLMIQVFLA